MYILTMLVFPSLVVLLLTAQANPQASQHNGFEQIAKQADAARSADHLNEALALYSKGVRLRPEWSEGWWSLGSLLYEQDRFPEAQEAFRRFVATATKPGPGYAFLALCEYETHDYEGALKHFQSWAKTGSPGNDALIDVAGFHWALLLTHESKFEQALYLLAAKAGKLGSTPALAEAMGLASLRMANLPEDYPPQKREMVWLAGRAALYSARQDFQRSDEYAGRLATRYGGEANVHYFLGTLLDFQRRFPEAAQEFTNELQISPQHVPAMVELALAQLENYKPEEAVPVAERAVTLEPKNARAHLAYGKALLATERLSEAAHELEVAKELAPGSPAVRSALANAYQRLGRLQEAKRESEAFLLLKEKEESLAPVEKKIDSPKHAVRPKP
jgi:tetratricopeptide (TPR) repeat protein